MSQLAPATKSAGYCPSSLYETVYQALNLQEFVIDSTRVRKEHIVKKRKKRPLTKEEDQLRLTKGVNLAAIHQHRINQAIELQKLYLKRKNRQNKALADTSYLRLTKVYVSVDDVCTRILVHADTLVHTHRVNEKFFLSLNYTKLQCSQTYATSSKSHH